MILCNELNDIEIEVTGLPRNAVVRHYIINNVISLPTCSVPRLNRLWNEARQLKTGNDADQVTQWFNDKGNFQIKRMYSTMTGVAGMMKCKWHKRVWTCDNPARENLLLWKVLNKALLTKDILLGFPQKELRPS